MKKISIIFMFFLAFPSISQVNEQFSDGDFTENPAWTGTADNFIVNEAFELQSAAEAASKSFLFTPSEAFDDAVWECRVKINYPASASNYASVYLTSDRNDSIENCNAYYVQIGGMNDEVSLFLQQGTKKTKIIAGRRKRIESDTVQVWIRAARSTDGTFTLYSRLPGEDDYSLEGAVRNTALGKADYFGLMFSNTAKTGHCYFFDDIMVRGSKAADGDAPEWVSCEIEQPGQVQAVFSEAMDFTEAAFEVDNKMGSPARQTVSPDKKSITLTFSKSFEPGVLYTLKTQGLGDAAGNRLVKEWMEFGIAELIEPGDIVINEVMFEQPESSYEYIEVYNASLKLIDASEIIFTTRKADGSLNAGSSVSEKLLLEPGSYLAVSENAEAAGSYHNCPHESRIVSIKWNALNNREGTIVLADMAKERVYDELVYHTKWHHPLIKDTKGVALERISPFLATQSSDSWHSASSESNYGTPGYCNSQHRGLHAENEGSRWLWLDPEAFSPDNDGADDVCFIHYATDEPGYAANIFILNASGIEVCRLASNALLSTQGTIIWDGKTAKGSNAGVGIYILYAEMFHAQKGIKKQFKLPVVVSGR